MFISQQRRLSPLNCRRSNHPPFRPGWLSDYLNEITFVRVRVRPVPMGTREARQGGEMEGGRAGTPNGEFARRCEFDWLAVRRRVWTFISNSIRWFGLRFER